MRTRPGRPRPARVRGRNDPKREGSPVPCKKAARRRTAPRRYVLRLYVTGSTGKSVRAIQNVRRICEEHLEGQYELEVVDIYKNLPLARGDQIIAAPTLIKRLPAPLRRLIGDMSDEEEVLVGLDCGPADTDKAGSSTADGETPGALPARPSGRYGGVCTRRRIRSRRFETATSMRSWCALVTTSRYLRCEPPTSLIG